MWSKDYSHLLECSKALHNLKKISDGNNRRYSNTNVGAVKTGVIVKLGL